MHTFRIGHACTPFSLSAVHTNHYVTVEIMQNECVMDLRATKWSGFILKLRSAIKAVLSYSPDNEKERKKERKNDKWLFFFEHLVLACTIVLMNDLGLSR